MRARWAYQSHSCFHTPMARRFGEGLRFKSDILPSCVNKWNRKSIHNNLKLPSIVCAGDQGAGNYMCCATVQVVVTDWTFYFDDRPPEGPHMADQSYSPSGFPVLVCLLDRRSRFLPFSQKLGRNYKSKICITELYTRTRTSLVPSHRNR